MMRGKKKGCSSINNADPSRHKSFENKVVQRLFLEQNWIHSSVHWVKVKETQLNVKKKQNILLPLDKSGEAIK
jgi:hypothetical protein